MTSVPNVPPDPGTDEYRRALNAMSFPLTDSAPFPEVIISYATQSAEGSGEWWMWFVANTLKRAGIASYNGKQNKAGHDWYSNFFGRLPMAKVFIAMVSAKYFESEPCRNEIFEAARENLFIIPLVLGTPPKGLRQGVCEPYFGANRKEKSTTENLLRGNVVSQRVNNYLPPPDRDGGLFQNDIETNVRELVATVQEVLAELRPGSWMPPLVPVPAPVAATAQLLPTATVASFRRMLRGTFRPPS